MFLNASEWTQTCGVLNGLCVSERSPLFGWDDRCSRCCFLLFYHACQYFSNRLRPGPVSSQPATANTELPLRHSKIKASVWQLLFLMSNINLEVDCGKWKANIFLSLNILWLVLTRLLWLCIRGSYVMTCVLKSHSLQFNAESAAIFLVASFWRTWRACGSASRSWMTDSNLTSREQWNTNVGVSQKRRTVFTACHHGAEDAPSWELTAPFVLKCLIFSVCILVQTCQSCRVLPVVFSLACVSAVMQGLLSVFHLKKKKNVLQSIDALKLSPPWFSLKQTVLLTSFPSEMIRLMCRETARLKTTLCVITRERGLMVNKYENNVFCWPLEAPWLCTIWAAQHNERRAPLIPACDVFSAPCQSAHGGESLHQTTHTSRARLKQDGNLLLWLVRGLWHVVFLIYQSSNEGRRSEGP